MPTLLATPTIPAPLTPPTLPNLPTPPTLLYSYLRLPTPTYAYLRLPTLTHSDLLLPTLLYLTHQVRFISKLEKGYKSRDDVPFHNRSHAADVVQGTAYFLNQAALKMHLQPLDVFALILSAAMHDHNHPGVTNAFLVHSQDELAILYNDASVLEMHHLASSWKLLLGAQNNPFDGMSPEQYNEVRQTIIHVILGTDMKYHFDHLTKFKTRRGSGAFEAPDRKDVRLMLAMCLHSADVGNPAKPWKLSCEWSARVMDEFFRQGDTEMSRGLPVSPFMDREKTDIAKCQIGFIKCEPHHLPRTPPIPALHTPHPCTSLPWPRALTRAPSAALASSLLRAAALTVS